jgi:hypothetical protein
MQNSNEAYFKNKYLKYKAKYLELKDLLEGGNPPKTEADEIKYPLLTKLKTLCITSSRDKCKEISEKHCNKGIISGCNFSIQEGDKDGVEAELKKKEDEQIKKEAELKKKEDVQKKEQEEYDTCKKIVITRQKECFNLTNEKCCKEQNILCKWDRPKDKKVSMCMRKSEKPDPQEEEEMRIDMKKIVEDAERQHGVSKK